MPRLAALPGPGEPAAGTSYRLVVSETGRGDRTVGHFRLSKGTLVVESSCLGPGSLTVESLFAEGPCDGTPGVGRMSMTGHTLTVVMKAQPTTQWAIYILQPR